MQYEMREEFMRAVVSNFAVNVERKGAIQNVTPDRTYVVPKTGKRGKPWMKIDVRDSNLQVSINVRQSDMNSDDALRVNIPNTGRGNRTRFTFTSNDAFHFAFYPHDCIDFSSEPFIEFLNRCYMSYQRR